jgi:hypothetical protein
MPPTFDQTFSKLFPWWTGSESQFLSIMDMLHKIEGQNDWVYDFHNFRITALVLQSKERKTALLLHDIIESAYNDMYMSWFEPFARSFHRLRLVDELSNDEQEFLSEMTLMEREHVKKRSFTELWFNWREVKMLYLRSKKISCFPYFASANKQFNRRLWNTVQRDSLSFRRNFSFDKLI